MRYKEKYISSKYVGEFSLSKTLGNAGIRNLTSFIQKLFNAWQSNKQRLDSLPDNCRGFDVEGSGTLSLIDIKAAFLSSGVDLTPDELLLLAKVANVNNHEKPIGGTSKNAEVHYQGLINIVFSYIKEKEGENNVFSI